jgi:translation elongation factor EF-Tu-like GTPase
MDSDGGASEMITSGQNAKVEVELIYKIPMSE